MATNIVTRNRGTSALLLPIVGDTALSSYHTKHRFVTSALYELPISKGKALLNTGVLRTATVRTEGTGSTKPAFLQA